MTISNTVAGGRWRVARKGRAANLVTRHPSPVTPRSGFTMVEIAISLAIIGIALVGILGVLPIGLNVQRETREGTVINQDATIFMEAIRNGARGDDDLTNYVYAITNFWGKYDPNGAFTALTPYGFIKNYPGNNNNFLTNGANIIGLLSIPKYTADATLTNPVNNLANGGYSNSIAAYVHSLSGPAVEKPPQDNDIVVGDSFGYRIVCDNLPVQTDPNSTSRYITNLSVNLHELRLTFRWPQRPNGSVGLGHQTFRALVAGQVAQTNDAGNILYFFQSQSFTNAP
jgi:prepilin-type N-terminal cleavage/methylation domain-containing protein